MSCIIGVIHQDKVYAGADSLAAQNEDGSKGITKDEKLFIKNGLLIGSVGVPRVQQIIKYNMTFPKYEKGVDPFKYIVNKFVVKLQECLRKHGSVSNGSDIQNFGETVIMVGIKIPEPRLFIVCSNFQVEEECNPYMAIGSGEKYALGSLHATGRIVKHWGPTQRIGLALEAAEKFNNTVGKPFIFKIL